MAQTLLVPIEKGEDFEATLMTPEMYAAHWPEISKELDRIPQFWTPWFTKEYLRTAPLHGMHIWNAGPPGKFHLIVYAQVFHYVAGTAYQIVFAFGNHLDKAIPILEATFERIAAQLDCDYFEIIGRDGWGRKLQDAKKIATIFRRDVPKFGVH